MRGRWPRVRWGTLGRIPLHSALCLESSRLSTLEGDLSAPRCPQSQGTSGLVAKMDLEPSVASYGHHSVDLV